MVKTVLTVLALIAGVGGMAAWKPASAPKYRLVDLGTLPGGDYSMACAINNKGQVVGLSSTGRELIGGLMRDTRAVLWDNGSVRDLIGNSQQCPEAFAINDLGQVLIRPQVIGGKNPGSIPAPMSYVARWDNGKTKVWKWNEFQACAQNNKGTLAGYLPIDGPRAAVCESGHVRVLAIPSVHEQSRAHAINDAGLVGGSFQHGDRTHGFVIVSGKTTDPTPKANENFGGFTAINGKGEAAETTRDDNWDTRLLVWSNGKSRDLGALGRYGSVSGMNDRGMIVGDRVGKPFLYSRGHFYTPSQLLTGSHTQVDAFTGINDKGQIAGYMEVKGTCHAVRLDPVP